MTTNSPPTPSQTKTNHSHCSLHAQSLTTKLGKHSNTANSDGIPNTKPLGTNPTQMKSSDSARVVVSTPQNQINDKLQAPTLCGLSCSTTSPMTKKVTSHTHKLSARFARPKPTPILPVSSLVETPSTTSESLFYNNQRDVRPQTSRQTCQQTACHKTIWPRVLPMCHHTRPMAAQMATSHLRTHRRLLWRPIHRSSACQSPTSSLIGTLRSHHRLDWNKFSGIDLKWDYSKRT